MLIKLKPTIDSIEATIIIHMAKVCPKLVDVYTEKIKKLQSLAIRGLQQSYNIINRHDGGDVETSNETEQVDYMALILDFFSSSSSGTGATSAPPPVRPMDIETRNHVFRLYHDALEEFEIAAASTIKLSGEDDDAVTLTDLDMIVLQLEKSIAISQSIPIFIPLKKHFPWEHFLAMFAPLLFPLLLPFFISLIRERKRYYAKIAAKKPKMEKE